MKFSPFLDQLQLQLLRITDWCSEAVSKQL